MYLLLHPHHHYVYFNFKNPCTTKQNQQTRRGVVSVLLSRRSKSERGIAAAARDRVIDFGKYKGKMLGSLPSSYLKWVSKNLRAGDFEEWASLADQVLRDPIYRDRIEWEFALNVLNGNACSSLRLTSSGSGSGSGGAVTELEDISERFGWDYLDKVGWSKLDFDLLGTSKGGRIPRLDNSGDTHPPKQRVRGDHAPPEPSSSSRRTERRERRKMRTLPQEEEQQLSNNFNFTREEEEEDEKKKKKKNVPIANPFPGRQALLRRAINHRTTQTQTQTPTPLLQDLPPHL